MFRSCTYPNNYSARVNSNQQRLLGLYRLASSSFILIFQAFNWYDRSFILCYIRPVSCYITSCYTTLYYIIVTLHTMFSFGTPETGIGMDTRGEQVTQNTEAIPDDAKSDLIF